jgi:hypothetical protein
MGGPLLQPAPEQRERSTTVPAIIGGIVLVVLVVGAIAILSRKSGSSARHEPHPYSEKLKFSDLHMSTSANFVGATVTYLDGKVTNVGDKTVTGATAQVTFRNSLNEVAQREDLPLRILVTTGPYPDAVDMSQAPLAPGQTRDFRLTLEHISADWNQVYPELRITHVDLK